MPKKALCLLIFGCIYLLLGAAVGVSTVKMEDHAGAVCRVVIGFTEEAQYQISDHAGSLDIRVQDFDNGSKARIYAAKSTLVTGVEQRDELLQISIAKPFRYETMSFDYPRRLAIDIFLAQPNRGQRLAIADFYAEIGKLNSADKAYNALNLDYKNDPQVLYHWALLLAKRGSARLGDVVAKIPQDSAYYERAHKLLAKLHSDEEPLPPPPPEPAPAPEVAKVADSVAVAAIQPAPDSSKADVAPVAQPAQVTGKQWDYRPLLLIGLVALLFVILYIMLYAKKHPHHHLLDEEHTESQEPDLDNPTLNRMVSKLLDDGWTNKEIARELKLGITQVNHIIHKQHQRKGLDEDR